MPDARVDKLIVSNLARLTTKYGPAGTANVMKAIQALVTADAARGLVSAFVDLSDSAGMQARGASVVTDADAHDPKKNKAAIDALFASAKIQPTHLLLLGSTDVIPHVSLKNPMKGDGDDDVPSDLPYAHTHAYSDDVQDFLNPTRAVGRLPNVTGDRDEAYLVGLLDAAAKHAPRPVEEYRNFLGISARVWSGSTRRSLADAFGTAKGMRLSPRACHMWGARSARRLSHFVNCHGAPVDANFYGDDGVSRPPIAHAADWMASRVVAGTVMAAECCYGAELYDPSSEAAPNHMSMCNTYLGRRAAAYFGSTNTAYGPADGFDFADLMCARFFSSVLAGYSVGQACLKTRLDYVQGKGGAPGPTDLKTVAQFNLMADPSLVPVAVQPVVEVSPAAPGKKGPKSSPAADARRNLRRHHERLRKLAEETTAHRLSPSPGPTKGKAGIFNKLRELAADRGIKSPDVFLSYEIGATRGERGAEVTMAKAVPAGSVAKTVYVVLEWLNARADEPNLRLVRGLQVMELEGKLDVSEFESR